MTIQEDFNSRLRKLKPEHRLELLYSKVHFEKCMKLRQISLKKAMEHFREYEKTYYAEWKKQYDFDIGIELFELYL